MIPFWIAVIYGAVIYAAAKRDEDDGPSASRIAPAALEEPGDRVRRANMPALAALGLCVANGGLDARAAILLAITAAAFWVSAFLTR